MRADCAADAEGGPAIPVVIAAAAQHVARDLRCRVAATVGCNQADLLHPIIASGIDDGDLNAVAEIGGSPVYREAPRAYGTTPARCRLVGCR